MIVWIVGFFLLAGSAFGLIAAIGLIRMPDLYCRMHAATKAGAFGVALLLAGLCIAAPEPRILIQSALILVFYYLTAPIGAHMIGRRGLSDPAEAPDAAGIQKPENVDHSEKKNEGVNSHEHTRSNQQ